MANSTHVDDVATAMSNSEAQQNPNQTQPSPPFIDLETIFRTIHTYPWEQDAEFQSGLSSILQSTTESASDENVHLSTESLRQTDLLLSAQCFYFAR